MFSGPSRDGIKCPGTVHVTDNGRIVAYGCVSRADVEEPEKDEAGIIVEKVFQITHEDVPLSMILLSLPSTFDLESAEKNPLLGLNYKLICGKYLCY